MTSLLDGQDGAADQHDGERRHLLDEWSDECKGHPTPDTRVISRNDSKQSGAELAKRVKWPK